MPRGIQRLLLIVFILGIALMGAIAMVSMKPEPPKREVENRDPLVDVLVLEANSTRFTIRSQGTVRPRTQTVLSAEVSGTITSISPKFIAGGVFDAGEVLMRIDPTNYNVAVEKAEALVRQRQIEYDGAVQLRSQGYRAEAELASSEAALASAQAELVRARRDLERTYIRLPYEGMVRAKDTDLGQFVSPGTRLGVVFATDYAEVRLPLTDSDLAFVDLPSAAAMDASGTVDGPEVSLSAVQRGLLSEWPARIVRSEGVVDESSRVTYAVARIEDPYRLHDEEGTPLPIGTFVAASIEGNTMENIMRVPRNVLRGTSELLFVGEEERISIRNVDVVYADADYAYIRSGATPGERVILTALEAPFNGMPVRTDADEPVEADSEDESAEADPEQVASAEEDGE